ncbi:allophanate hydrolase subunit 1 [Frankia sp. CeD]|uniref:5-oxoprolinase subunit B family protein n=1 Tax=Frankia sp. CeD TaxID=258230 RepID=UPI0004DCF166|nr:allophanate hydrolase subunit 1 [Frankia sp. CeD]KEZ35805.1 allophanate hydrolase subunit 1 [Frankia sp. CeD]
MRILPCGDEALLVEVAGLTEAEALYARLRRIAPVGIIQLVPAARTVLVAFDPAATDARRLSAALLRAAGAQPGTSGPTPSSGPAPQAGPPLDRDVVTIPVHYDGPDLAEVARLSGLTPAQVVDRHVRGRHRVAFCGFAPGFAYIAGLDPALRVPRRDSPRTRVPAGAVAIADEFSGVYPRTSPGGWRLIGHTDLRVFDPDREPPAVLAPGTRVRFIADADAIADAARSMS